MERQEQRLFARGLERERGHDRDHVGLDVVPRQLHRTRRARAARGEQHDGAVLVVDRLAGRALPGDATVLVELEPPLQTADPGVQLRCGPVRGDQRLRHAELVQREEAHHEAQGALGPDHADAAVQPLEAGLVPIDRPAELGEREREVTEPQRFHAAQERTAHGSSQDRHASTSWPSTTFQK